MFCAKKDKAIHHRRSIRLKGYDYSQAGAYFITLCCQDRGCRFGGIKNGQMRLNEFGEIAYHEWETLTERFVHIELDVFQIMPNHVHGIIVLNDISTTAVADTVGAGFTPALTHAPAPTLTHALNNITHDPNDTLIPNNDLGNGQRRMGQPRGLPLRNHEQNGRRRTVGDIVGAYKSLVVHKCLDVYESRNETMGKFWQRNYYEHIIRDEPSYQIIAKYILHNPARRMQDEF